MSDYGGSASVIGGPLGFSGPAVVASPTDIGPCDLAGRRPIGPMAAPRYPDRASARRTCTAGQSPSPRRVAS
jgi:hypothetical protein